MHSTQTCVRTGTIMALVAMLISAARAQAQNLEASVDSLVARALTANPALHAARARAEATRARIAPAGVLPDPMLMAGVQNASLGSMASDGHGTPTLGDPMTMNMIGFAQTVPFPGKLGLRRRVASHEASAAEAAFEATARKITRDVQDAYYELAFLDRALEIVARNQRILNDFTRITEARYGVGTAGQEDVLRARVEATRLADEAVKLTEQRRGTLASLNALLDRPSDEPISEPRVPQRIARAAIADSVSSIRFVSSALGSRAADSPLPPLAELQQTALGNNPALREHVARIAAQSARVDLARRDYLPDVSVSVSYGWRLDYPDMVSTIVSVPLPIFKRRKQDAYVAADRAELLSMQAEHHDMVNELFAAIARRYSEAERQRAQLALYVKAILPQARASLASATASYQVGRVEFLTVIDNQSTLFSYETEYFRALTDFARTLAELEQLVGQEIIR